MNDNGDYGYDGGVDGGGDDGNYGGGYDLYGGEEEEEGASTHEVLLQQEYDELVASDVAIEELDNYGNGRCRLPAMVMKKNTGGDDGDDTVITNAWPADNKGLTIEQHPTLFVSVLSRRVRFKASADKESSEHLLNFCNCRLVL